MVVARGEERGNGRNPSPPWRFSTTTGCAQRCDSRSARSRPAISVPLPGGRGRMRRTVRCGHACANADAGPNASTTPRATRRASAGMGTSSSVSAARRFAECPRSLPYSITSSARANSVGGTSRPGASAVFRLITSSNTVGCCTGKSAGLAPSTLST